MCSEWQSCSHHALEHRRGNCCITQAEYGAHANCATCKYCTHVAVGIDLGRNGEPISAGGHDCAIVVIQPALHIVAHTHASHKLSLVHTKCGHAKDSMLHAVYPSRRLPGDILCAHLESELRSRSLPIIILCLLVIRSGHRRNRLGHRQLSFATHRPWQLHLGCHRTLVACRHCSLCKHGNFFHRTSPCGQVCPRC